MSLLEKLFKPKPEPEPKTENVLPGRIGYDSTELRELIIRWVENEGWKLSTFLNILERMGVKGNLHLSNLDKDNFSFTCVAGKEEPVQITLRFGDAFDFCSEIWITKGEETKRYELWSRSDAHGKAIIQEKGRFLQRDGKRLESFYCEFFCHRSLYFGDTKILRVEINEPQGSEDEKKVLRNAEAIEDYLISLEKPVSAQKVYQEVIKLLGFSEEDIRACDKIIVAYRDVVTTDKDKKEEETRSLVYLKNGEMQEYGILENGETYLVCRNGNWRYISDTVKIYFTAETKNCNVVMENAGTDQVKHMQLAQLMEQVEMRISELWQHVQ